MAVEILTTLSAKVLPEHGHLTLGGTDDLQLWNTMPQDGQELRSHLSFPTGSDPTLPGASYSEASSSGVSDGMPPPSAGSASSSKKRKPTKPKLSADLRRVVSTPHMRGLAQAETSPLSPTSDKRRNKLGYHRTSVACGECLSSYLGRSGRH